MANMKINVRNLQRKKKKSEINLMNKIKHRLIGIPCFPGCFWW